MGMIVKLFDDGMPELEEVNAELEELKDDPQPVLLQMDKVSAWVLLTHLQLALRHPENNGPTAQIARNIALSIQEALCADPESALARMARAGWKEKRIITMMNDE
jgi:hypothetical protein